MNEQSAAPEPMEACERLLTLAEAQAYALAAQDVEAFARVTCEREAFAEPLQGPVAAALVPAVRRALERVAALDRENLARARTLLQATERELREIRQGRMALQGYGRQGAHLASEPTRIDQQG